MSHISSKNQRGYVLLVVMLMFMGIGGVVLGGFTQEARNAVEKQRYEHNRRVLLEAKQALLQYAYDYPQFNVEGPGRIPCPDTNSSGTGNNDCTVVGRFPWNHLNLNFYAARDASNELLWYAASDTFRNVGGGPIVNADSVGRITILDQSGALVYDGAVAGIAAVIIAPGPITSRDEDNDVNGIYEYTQIRTPASQDNPRNYLEIFNGFDNSVFNNGESDTVDDGFILGPVKETDPNSPAFNTVVVNDQMVIVTAEEVIAMAEKATLQAYRDAIDAYQVNIGANRYPWLDPYSSADGLGTFDAVVTPPPAPAPVSGRLPSIFANYFDPSGPNPASQAIKPELRLSIKIDNQVHNLSIPAPGLEDISFDVNGNLSSSIDNGFSITRYFWDGHLGTLDINSPDDGVWEVCPIVTNDEEDCNRDAAGNFMGTAASTVELKVRQVTINFAGGIPIVFADGNRTIAGIEYWQASSENPDPQNHVYIAAEFDDVPGPSYISSFTYDQDDDFQNTFDILSSGVLIFDAGDTIKVGLPYYPVLPGWARTNGWHDTLMMAYSPEYGPGGDGVCTLEDGNPATGAADDCLVVTNLSGVSNNVISLFVIAGEHDLLDGDDLNNDLDYLDVNEVAPDNDFSNDLYDVFEPENYSGIGPSPFPINDPDPPSDTGLNLVFDKREDVVVGNSSDVIFVLDQQ